MSGTTNVLNGIDYAFEENKIYAIVGRSGSGKSTFLHILGGLGRPTEGEILFQGENLYKKSDEQMAVFRRRHMGFVFQQYNLLEEHNVLHNICMPIKLDHGVVEPQFLKEVAALLDLEDKLKRYPSQLSGGEQQRVAIARAILAKPELVIADEPTGNLDRATEETTIRLLADCAKRYGQTLIIVTHNPEVAAAAEVILHMEDGKLIG